MRERAFFNWSSGKDSALALHRVLQQNELEIVTLFTVVNRQNNCISMHETSLTLVRRQAEQLKLPLTIFFLDPAAPQEEYEKNMQQVMASFQSQGIHTAVYGDLYLEPLRQQRQENCARMGMKACFPLWNTPPQVLLEEFFTLGFRSVLTCVDANVLDESFVGETLSRDLIARFPAQADPCGEKGEYHSFVFDGPIFHNPVFFERKEKYYRDFQNPDGGAEHRFWYLKIT